MADEELEKLEQDAKTDEKKVVAWWKQAPTWQKAGVVIGALALVVAIAMYFRSNSSASSGTSSQPTNPSNPSNPVTNPIVNPISSDYIPTTTSGYGDTWPSLNNIPAQAAYTSTNPLATDYSNSNIPASTYTQANYPTSDTTFAATTSDQQAFTNLLVSAPPAGPSNLALGMVYTAPKSSIWNTFSPTNNNNNNTNSSNSNNNNTPTFPTLPFTAISKAPTYIPTTTLGSGWTMPVSSPPPRPSPAPRQQQSLGTLRGFRF